MLPLLALLACTDAALDTARPADDTGDAFLAPGELVDLGDHLARVVWVPSAPADPEGLAIRIVWPKAPARRHADGLPVVVTLNGGEDATNIGNPEQEIPVQYPGIVHLRIALPGGGQDPWISGGVDDRRGEGSIQAVGDVVAFAMGQGTSTEGWTLDELVGAQTDPAAVGLLGLSNGGNTVFAALVDRPDLDGVCWVGSWGTPVDSHYATAYMGDQVNDPDPDTDANGDGVLWNDMVDPDYVPHTCTLEGCPDLFRDLRFNGRYVWGDRNGDAVMGDGGDVLDLNGNGMRDPDEDMDYHWYTAVDGRQVYSLPVLRAIVAAGVLAEPWPADLVYTLDEAEAFWAVRAGVNHLGRIPAGVHAIVMGGAKGHLHAALDQPDLWVAYSLHRQAGRWTRLNSDAAYFEALRGEGDAPERAANVGLDLAELPTGLPDPDWDPVLIAAGVLEMSDRCHLDRWEEDLDAPLVPTQALPTP